MYLYIKAHIYIHTTILSPEASIYIYTISFTNIYMHIQHNKYIITPTSTPNSMLYSRTYLVFVLAKCHRSAMRLWFHWVFESQRRRHARLVSIGAWRQCRRRDSPVPAPAPGLDHDDGQITARSQPL